MKNVWIALAVSLLGFITFLYRYSFVSGQGRRIAHRIPPSFLKLLAPATFAAIVMNNYLSSVKDDDFSFKSIVLVVSLLVAYLTRSIMLTFSLGLVLLYSLKNFF